MTDVAIIRTASFKKLLSQISTKFNQVEAAEVIRLLKRQYPTKKDYFDQNDLYGALTQLYILGAIDDDGDQKLLEILAGKNMEVSKMLSGYKEVSSSHKNDFVGRDVDVSNILKRLNNHRVPGVNLFGDSGVGKTTLAKEVSKHLESFDTVFVDLRNIKCLKTVYFHILQALQLPSWDENKRERIYKHLEILKKETVLILDSIEQLLSRESQAEQETRVDFLEFLKVIIGSEASKKGHLKVILTSTTELNESELKGKLFTEYKVQPFSKNISKYFISKRVRGDVSDDQQDKAMFDKIADLCRNNPYLLHGAEQLMRESFATPTDVLRKITAQIGKGVPEHFACINALFESLPNDHLKQVAVKISLLRRPFTVSTANKITEVSSGYDTEFDLEMLAVHKIITAENVEEKRHNETKKKRKYDLHALFRDFVTSHLCKKDPVYKEQLKNGENQFFKHFSGKITKLANNLEREFVKTYVNLEINRANFELVFDLSEDHKETLDLLLHTDDHNQLALMGILFEVLKDEKERRELFGKWAEAAEKQEQWLTSSLMRCWQSIQGSDLEGTVNEEILEKAKTSIEKVHSTSPDEKLSKKLNEVNSLFLHCQGKIKWMKAKKLTLEQRTRKHRKKLLEEGIEHFKQSIEMRKRLNGDSTLTARALNLMGNCYMGLEDPLTAMTHYKQAMDMKVRLVGSENHWEIPTYYNQMAQVHDGLARKEEEKWFKRLFGFKEKAREEYGKAKEWMEKALALQEELGVSETNHTALFQRNLANILIGLEEYDQALEYAQKSLKIRNTLLGKHPETVRILYMIGIIHEWKNDLEGALASYEEAFVMEESLPEDNHSIVRKLLCDRLEAMCKKLKKKDKIQKLKERITKMQKIESSTPVRKDDTPITPTEPGIADTEHPVQEDLPGVPLPTDDTPVSRTEPGIADTEHPVQEDLQDVQLQPDDTPVTPTEQGIADTGRPLQEDLSGVPLPPDDTPITPTEPGIADTEHPVQEDLPGVPLPTDDTPVSRTEPGIADTEHPVQEDLQDVQLQPDDTPVTPTEQGIADTGRPLQEDLSGVPLPPDDTPITPTEPGIADTEHPVQEDLPGVPLPTDDTPVSRTEPGIADTEHPVQEDLQDVQLQPDDTPVTPTEQGIADTGRPLQEDLSGVPLPSDDTPITPTEPEIADTEHPPDLPFPLDDTFVASNGPGLGDTDHPVQEDLGIPDETGITDKIPSQCNTIIPEGGSVDIPMIGIRLDIPRNTVTQATTVICKKYTAESLPVTFPAGKDETVVSYIVGLEPSTIQLNKPISVSLMHSGPRQGYGYETVVKAFNKDSETWQEPIVLDRRQENVSAHCRNDYVEVEISTLTILAVVTRLITDRFQVSPKGCVVRSSVCEDVTIEFSEGAVDKMVEGTMKLLPMPKNIYKIFDVYASQMILIKGFENVELLKSVTIQMPHPCSTRYTTSQAKVVRLKNGEWEEVGDPKIEIKDTYVQFQVQHFCWLWLMIPIGTAVAVASALKMYEYLSAEPQAAFIAASRNKQLQEQMMLHCIANHKQHEILNRLFGASTVAELRSDRNGLLGESTVAELRPGEKVYTKIKGCFEALGEIHLFLKDEGEFSRLFFLKRKQQNTETEKRIVELVFYKKENEEMPLCEFKIEEDMIDPKCHDLSGSLSQDGTGTSAASTTYIVNISGNAVAAIGQNSSVNLSQHTLSQHNASLTSIDPAQQILPPGPSPSTAGVPSDSSPIAANQQILPPAPAPSTAVSSTASYPAATTQKILHPAPAPSTAVSPTASSPGFTNQQTLHSAPAPPTAGNPTPSSPGTTIQQTLHSAPAPSTAGNPTPSSPGATIRQTLHSAPALSTAGNPAPSSPGATIQQTLHSAPAPSTAGSATASSPAAVAEQTLHSAPAPSTAGSPTSSSPAAVAEQTLHSAPAPSTAGSPTASSLAAVAEQTLHPASAPSAESPTVLLQLTPPSVKYWNYKAS